ncbi:hypothetical protein HAX54_042756 [Datura stramonium]|uniref:Uncharacterized protein n=1 Tax=Datura stramonium TaxID=4076 RepID=A0ABS8SMG8_DATST|nr:hypothetical protein [Datura stramonium]
MEFSGREEEGDGGLAVFPGWWPDIEREKEMRVKGGGARTMRRGGEVLRGLGDFPADKWERRRRLLLLASGLGAILIYISGLSTPYGSYHLSGEDLEALQSLQSGFQKCVSANGLGLQASKVAGTIVGCATGNTVEQHHALTKEYIDALPNGWEDYAWRRINKGILLNRCENIELLHGEAF